MSLNSEELQQHCQEIIKQRRIKNKIVILCEGEIRKNQGRPSPQSYKKMEQMPDANFYHACVPSSWRQYRPQFFNCGDRKDVIDTYFNILKLHSKDTNNSYLSPEKLFAIVDLDIQIKKITTEYDYKFSDTEAAFTHLYDKGKVNQENIAEHRIWVTGLIHKEAYFLTPELQEMFDISLNTPIYEGNKLCLEKIYLKMADDIINDVDLQSHIAQASNRIDYCNGLDCSGVEELCNSWKSEFKACNDELRKHELIYSLLTLKKAKYYWNQIQAPEHWNSSIEAFKDQLLLKIGKFYSENSTNPRYHISFLLENLSISNITKPL
ncbi:hypothetical protein Riv7116_4076 [Rivularia sp. PCC 7116]|uniref:hypothetical protein n=1 Tax=Rivularia sp. PCC 7116 TaxID=373994 RepID=UPI00029EF1A5|nr:hypothetical protein [Rivularia sp. PCC 7116]AFY56513.1 hypothetical protein Riv7116_4076 [Rivularia sp. PCC 7116]